MRIVLDTNVWVSGILIPKSNAGIIIERWRQDQLTIVVSDPILKEIARVLLYPKILKRLNWDQAKINHYIDLLSFFAEKVDVTDCSVEVEKDPDDSPILATLVVSRADWLVTGDMVLLELQSKYKIISIAEFYKNMSG